MGELEVQYDTQLRISLGAYREQPPDAAANIPSLEELAAGFDHRSSQFCLSFNSIRACCGPGSKAEELLDAAGLWPRISPKILLRKLSLQERRETPQNWVENLSHLAEDVVLVQQERRLLRFATFNQTWDYATEALRSRDRGSHVDMDWLLFEIDSDRSIRSNQVEIAQAMVHPKAKENSVMQLNMGEGKSSVSS
jgi:hypothetical protein